MLDIPSLHRILFYQKPSLVWLVSGLGLTPQEEWILKQIDDKSSSRFNHTLEDYIKVQTEFNQGMLPYALDP